MGRKAVDSNEIFFDGLPATPEELVGEEGAGFHQLLQSLNPERILVAAEAVGIGQEALRRAADYAAERVVFDRPIGQNQAIQHPLARSWAELEAAWLLCLEAADLCDQGRPCGAQANAAKYLAAEAGYRACERAVLTFGRRAAAARDHDPAPGAGLAADGAQLHRRAGARPAEILLMVQGDCWVGRSAPLS
jgi:acyl-CoA dehydrogenase